MLSKAYISLLRLVRFHDFKWNLVFNRNAGSIAGRRPLYNRPLRRHANRLT